MLTDTVRPSGLLLMTFWKSFDGRMKIFWNVMIFSSGHRNYCEKSSEVNMWRFNIPLETYFDFLTFWRVFSILESLSWFSMFFLHKKKKKKLVFFFKIQENDSRIENTRQNVKKSKYVSNGILKRHIFTSDDFLKRFR